MIKTKRPEGAVTPTGQSNKYSDTYIIDQYLPFSNSSISSREVNK